MRVSVGAHTRASTQSPDHWNGCDGHTGVGQRYEVRLSSLRNGLMAVGSSVADLLSTCDFGGGEAFGEGLDFF